MNLQFTTKSSAIVMTSLLAMNHIVELRQQLDIASQFVRPEVESQLRRTMKTHHAQMMLGNSFEKFVGNMTIDKENVVDRDLLQAFQKNRQLIAMTGGADSSDSVGVQSTWVDEYGITHYNTGFRSCYQNCYTNCHSACHGNRGWR